MSRLKVPHGPTPPPCGRAADGLIAVMLPTILPSWMIAYVFSPMLVMLRIAFDLGSMFIHVPESGHADASGGPCAVGIAGLPQVVFELVSELNTSSYPPEIACTEQPLGMVDTATVEFLTIGLRPSSAAAEKHVSAVVIRGLHTPDFSVLKLEIFLGH